MSPADPVRFRRLMDDGGILIVNLARGSKCTFSEYWRVTMPGYSAKTESMSEVGVRQLACAAALVLSAACAAGAEEKQYSFALSKGAGLPVCEALLKAALAALPEVVGQCDLPPPRFEHMPPSQFINWQVLREKLGAEFKVPEWRLLDMSRREDLERATFALAITNGPLMASSYAPDGWGDWSSLVPDEEIWIRVRRYIEEGGLSRDLLLYPEVLNAVPPFRFSSAEFDYGGTKNEAIRLEVVRNQPKVCFEERADPYTNIVIFQQETEGHAPGEAEYHDQHDIITFDGELFGVIYSYWGRQPLFVSSYVRGKHFNDFPANTSTCTLELQIEED